MSVILLCYSWIAIGSFLPLSGWMMEEEGMEKVQNFFLREARVWRAQGMTEVVVKEGALSPADAAPNSGSCSKRLLLLSHVLFQSRSFLLALVVAVNIRGNQSAPSLTTGHHYVVHHSVV